jgi:hypothetical protein
LSRAAGPARAKPQWGGEARPCGCRLGRAG